MALKTRLAYTKKNEARYIAHLDLTRVFDRALRRAEVDVLFSEGFNPHPKISFGPPLPVGVEGVEEYVDIDLKWGEDEVNHQALQQLVDGLNRQLPEGIRVIDIAVMPQGAKALMAVISLARYQIEVPMLKPITAAAFQNACDRWLQRKEAIGIRNQKGNKVERNIRPFVYRLSVNSTTEQETGLFRCQIDIKTGNEGSARPVEILDSIRQLEDVPIDLPGVLTTREGLYIQKGQELLTPIEYLKVQ